MEKQFGSYISRKIECLKCVKLMSFIPLIALISFQTGTVHTLDMSRALEAKCFDVGPPVQPNILWMMSVDNWYFPIMNYLDLYLSLQDVLRKDIKDITQEEVDKSCLRWGFEPSVPAFFVKAFGGKRRADFTLVPLAPGVIRAIPNKNGKYAGLATIIMTDNKSFVVIAVCTPDNYIAWGVISTTPTLPEETVQKIFKHVTGLGFKMEFVTTLGYKECQEEPKHLENTNFLVRLFNGIMTTFQILHFMCWKHAICHTVFFEAFPAARIMATVIGWCLVICPSIAVMLLYKDKLKVFRFRNKRHSE